ncbi:MAG: hypothetical protein K2K57_12640 [Oscillospiraceae bacterium]|nr:hypothetical protein [Oscillospiraceae bacterium]
MSMIIAIEFPCDLAVYHDSYGIEKSTPHGNLLPYFDESKFWTVEGEFFDEMVTDAYNILSVDINGDCLLMDFLNEILPQCTKMAMYWVCFEKENAAHFNTPAEFIEGIKKIIADDYKCMFHCFYTG